jgi:hypothetical protein
MRLEDGSYASWLTISDEYSGAILYTVAFPHKHWNQIAPHLVQHHIQCAMEIWGMPQAMRFDNGTPWGTASPAPSAMALWLAGLGIGLEFGRPRVSTDNAIVERAHGVLNNWVCPTHCQDFDALCTRLEYFTCLQRERYPVGDHASRLAAHPELLSIRRPYDRTVNEANWDASAMHRYLAHFRFQRKVEVNGRVTVLGGEYSVGREYKRQTVAIQFDAVTVEWVVYDDIGTVLKRFKPTNLSYDQLMTLKLFQRRPSSATKGKP